MAIPGLKDFFKGSAEGLISGVTNGAANIISKLKADPTKVFEAETELEKLKITTSLELEKISVQMEQESTKRIEAHLKDVDSARNMNTKIQESDKSSWLSKNIAYIMDLMFIISFIIMLIMIFNRSIPESNKEIFYTGFGLLGGYVGTILNFHRGTSLGSEKKQKHIEEFISRSDK